MSYSNVSISIPFVRALRNRVKTLVLYPLTTLVLNFRSCLITASI
jgi:hypothetical protein